MKKQKRIARITPLNKDSFVRTHSGVNALSAAKNLGPGKSHRRDKRERTLHGLKLSIVVPIFNERNTISSFIKAVRSVLQDCQYDYELIFVDDGSTDKSIECLLDEQLRCKNIKVVKLSRNFGKEQALTAGLEFASGEVVVPMDVDLQDPPAVIPKMLEKWLQGFDVVYAVRASRKRDSIMKRLTAKLFYSSFNAISEVQIPANAGDFRLMDRRVVDVIRTLPEHNRFMKGLFSWVGFRQTSVYFDRPMRAAGASKWNYWRLWNFALDGMFGFSTLPLKLWSYIGMLVSLGAFAYAIALFVRTLVFGIDVPGYASLMVVMLFLGGVQLLSLGVIGEYLGRLYTETKQRPLYLVAETWGFEHDGEPK